MATVLIAHGAWAAGWLWRKLREPMRDRGHELVVPTLTGIGERHHLAQENICPKDILQVLEFEDLHDVLLVGHTTGEWSRAVLRTECRNALGDSSISMHLYPARASVCSMCSLRSHARRCGTRRE
jgi:hypothetical protein